jgi:hypothetical protein
MKDGWHEFRSLSVDDETCAELLSGSARFVQRAIGKIFPCPSFSKRGISFRSMPRSIDLSETRPCKSHNQKILLLPPFERGNEGDLFQ